jgi:FixJ family two-component response regulator
VAAVREDTARRDSVQGLLLDVILHGRSGFEILGAMRQLGYPTPALMLTCISHTPSAPARDKAVPTSLRSFSVLDVLFKYASAR